MCMNDNEAVNLEIDSQCATIAQESEAKAEAQKVCDEDPTLTGSHSPRRSETGEGKRTVQPTEIIDGHFLWLHGTGRPARSPIGFERYRFTHCNVDEKCGTCIERETGHRPCRK